MTRGKWHIGARTRTYVQRPPAGKVVTHEGRDLDTGEPVGVLLLRPPWHQNPSVRRDYRHGVGLLQRLDHAHVVKVRGLIDEEDLFAVVTEPLPGDNLHRHLRYGGRIPTEDQVVRLMLQVASGLEHGHERGVVFGNVKPTNVEFFPDGTAKLFAVPKPPYQFTSFLDAADYLGYPVYNSPEVLRCEPPDPRTDIYGLGVCAYEMIVSQLPHQPSGNLGADFRALATGEWPSPADIVGPIHPLLNKIVVRCLQKDRAQRYPGVAELLKDLHRVQASSAPLIRTRASITWSILTGGVSAV